MHEKKPSTKLISTLASIALLFLTALPIQAFTRRQPSSPPPPASRRFVTQEAIERHLPPCKFFTKEGLLRVLVANAIKPYFPMLVRIHNPKGQFKFENPRPIAMRCAVTWVTFKADGIYTTPGSSQKRTISFIVYIDPATITYVPRRAPQLPIVKSATACPRIFKVDDDSDLPPGMKDAAQRQLDYNARSGASCFSILPEVLAYVQKGGKL